MSNENISTMENVVTNQTQTVRELASPQIATDSTVRISPQFKTLTFSGKSSTVVRVQVNIERELKRKQNLYANQVAVPAASFSFDVK